MTITVEPHNDMDIIRSPYDGHEVGRLPVASETEVEVAIERARRAFEVTRRLPRFVRADILERAAGIIASRRKELELLIAEEAGKPLYDARGELSRSIFNLRNAAAEARSFAGHEVPLDIDAGVFEYQNTGASGEPMVLAEAELDLLSNTSRRIGIARRFPLGPVLAITPFNFPLNLVLHKVAPALAVGAPVVVKPAPQTPLTAVRLGEILAEAGLVEGAYQVVHCPVALAERMVQDERFGVVTFTGSVPVGWRIKALAGKKRVTLELGGNAAVIVDEDADIERAAARCVRGGVVYGGQYCIGVQRILVHRSRMEDFSEALLEKVRACRVGNPLEEGIDVGPVIDSRAADRIHAWIQEAVEDGARVLVGGGRDGNVIMPTVLTDTRPSMKVEAEEIFGPVMTLNAFETVDEAVKRANDFRFGLQGGFFTNNLQNAFRALENWDVGALMINDVSIYRIDNMPFGGWKDSGFGREGTRYAMEAMTEIKFLVVNYA